MTMKYFRPSVKVEPIIWEWYAWSYLIPPATAACNIVGRHIKIMDSYISMPQAHAQAVKNPKMLGGPFIDLNGEKVAEVQQLIEKTKENCANLIALDKALKECDRMLKEEAVGEGLTEFYSRIPDSLGGMVELVYDLNNHATLRLIEPLLYKKYYSTQCQALDISETLTDFRPFALSTPCLETEDKMRFNIAFNDPRLDILFKAKENAQSLASLIDIFNVPVVKQKSFNSFFTEMSPNLAVDRNYAGDGVRIRYLGHACVLVETKNASILIDPVISYPVQSTIPRFTFNDLPERINYVVITHNHQDHVMLESLIALRHKIDKIIIPAGQKGALADPSLKLILQALGFHTIVELDEMESIPVKDGKITGIPFFGEHSDLNIQTKLAYMVELFGQKLMFLADSNNLDTRLYQYIFNEVGAIDFLFIGMECEGAPLTWLYGPLLSTPIKRSYDYSRTLSGSNYEKAWILAELSKTNHAYVYAMGQEPWLNYVMALKYDNDSPQIRESDKFVAACLENGINSERLFGRKEWLIAPKSVSIKSSTATSLFV